MHAIPILEEAAIQQFGTRYQLRTPCTDAATNLQIVECLFAYNSQASGATQATRFRVVQGVQSLFNTIIYWFNFVRCRAPHHPKNRRKWLKSWTSSPSRSPCTYRSQYSRRFHTHFPLRPYLCVPPNGNIDRTGPKCSREFASWMNVCSATLDRCWTENDVANRNHDPVHRTRNSNPAHEHDQRGFVLYQYFYFQSGRNEK